MAEPRMTRFPDELWHLVELESRRTGASAAEVVRRAVEHDLAPRAAEIAQGAAQATAALRLAAHVGLVAAWTVVAHVLVVVLA